MNTDEIVALVISHEDEFTDAAAGNMAALWVLGMNVRSAIAKEFWLGIIVGIMTVADADPKNDESSFTISEVLIRLDDRMALWTTMTTLKFLRLVSEMTNRRPPFDPRNN